MNGKISSGELQGQVTTVIYDFNDQNMEVAAININIVNDNPYPVKVSFGFEKNNIMYDYEHQHTLQPYESLERTGIVVSMGEKIVATSEQDNVFYRIHGYEENITSLTPTAVRWVTDAIIPNFTTTNIMYDFIADGAERFELIYGNLPFGVNLTNQGLLHGTNPRDDNRYEITIAAIKGNYRKLKTFYFTCENVQPDLSNLTLSIPTLYKGTSSIATLTGGKSIYNDILTYKLHLPNGFTANKITNILENEQFSITTDNTVADDYHIFQIECNDSKTGNPLKSFSVFVSNVDLTPNPFTIDNILNAEINTTYESNMVIITGLQPNTKIFPMINNGLYRISDNNDLNNLQFVSFYNNGVMTNSNGELYLQLQTTTDNLFNRSKYVELTIGTIVTYWEVKTREIDNNPTDFNITAKYNVDLAVEVISDEVTIGGLEREYEVLVISNFNGQIDCAGYLPYTNTYVSSMLVKTDSNGQIKLKCRMISPNTFDTSKVMIVKIGNVEKEFTIRTKTN